MERPTRLDHPFRLNDAVKHLLGGQTEFQGGFLERDAISMGTLGDLRTVFIEGRDEHQGSLQMDYDTLQVGRGQRGTPVSSAM